MPSLTRRGCAGLAAGAVAGLSPILGPAVWSATPKTKMRVGVLPILDTAPLFAAHAQGYFDDERLEIEMISSQGGGPSFEALIAGDLEACTTNAVTAILVDAKGITCPLIGCGASVGKGPPHDVCALMVRADSKIANARDLNGKRVAVEGIDGITWLCTRMWADNNGGNSATIQFTEVPFPQMADALLNRRVDAIVYVEPFITALIQDQPNRAKIVAWVFSAASPDVLLSGVFTTQAYIERERQAIEGFCRAYRQGVGWVRQNFGKPPLFRLISDYSKISLSILQHMEGWPVYESKVSPKSFLTLAKAMVRYKLLARPPKNANEMVFRAIRL